jgi:ABC-2 type transport system ATP-binding protein
MESSDPTSELLELAKKFGGEIPELEVRRPSLEDIYLRMIEEK